MTTHSGILAWSNLMDREAWKATVHSAEKSWIGLKMAYAGFFFFSVCAKSDNLFFPCLAQYHKCFLSLLFL